VRTQPPRVGVVVPEMRLLPRPACWTGRCTRQALPGLFAPATGISGIPTGFSNPGTSGSAGLSRGGVSKPDGPGRRAPLLTVELTQLEALFEALVPG
jgi:hypothetical protein